MQATLLHGTQVKTTLGCKLVEELRLADRVMSAQRNAQSGILELIETTIEKIHEFSCKKIVVIKTKSELILAHENQKFYDPVNEKWLKAHELTTNNYLMNALGNFCTCDFIQIYKLEHEIPCYNITLKEFHALFVGEQAFLSHNFISITIGTAGIKLAVEWVAAACFAVGIVMHKSNKDIPPDLLGNNASNLNEPSNQDPNKPDPNKPDPSKSSLKICDEVVRELRSGAGNKYKHILEEPKHNLHKIGKPPNEAIDKTLKSLQKAIDNKTVSNSGKYLVKDVVDGHKLEIRGVVTEEKVKIGTFFIDKNCC